MTYYITNSGRRIYLSNISVDDICIRDIAHHLTKICRYGGALPLNYHYSVAQHSILLTTYAREKGFNEEIQKALLMHDATEAYLGDIVSGLKSLLPDYINIELKIKLLIAKKYSICVSPNTEKIIKELDTRILLDEAMAFVPSHYKHFTEQLHNLKPLGVSPAVEYDQHNTYSLFLLNCKTLGIKD